MISNEEINERRREKQCNLKHKKKIIIETKRKV